MLLKSSSSCRETREKSSCRETREERIRTLVAHLSPPSQCCANLSSEHVSSPVPIGSLSLESTYASTSSSQQSRRAYKESNLMFASHDLRKVLHDAKYEFLRDQIFELASQEPLLFQVRNEEYQSVEMQQQQAMKRMHRFAHLYRMEDLLDEPTRIFCILESVSILCHHTAFKLAMHYMCGSSLLFLGSQEHHKHWIPRMNKLDACLAFCMAELCHGSNAQAIETVANYKVDSDEFEITTPSDTAQKVWCANALLHANAAIVFAQLMVHGQNHGIHALVVPLRNEHDHSVLPGVVIREMGHTHGMNGVDMARLWFKGLRVPRKNLLNRFAQVDTEMNEYTSSIKQKSSLFRAHTGKSLLLGRVSTCVTSVCGMKLALTIALRYALSRRQFALPSQLVSANDDLVALEIPIINYQSHQRQLFPYLATTFAMHFTLEHIKRRMKHLAMNYNGKNDPEFAESLALAGALKAYITSTFVSCAQACRECCGALGLASVNRLGSICDAADAALSFESGNAVLVQYAARHLLLSLHKQFSQKGQMITSMQFLLKTLRHSFMEMNPVNIRNVNPTHLESEVFQLKAFEYREQTLILELAKVTQQGSSNEENWNSNLDLVQALTSAHVERVMLQQFMHVMNSEKVVSEKVKPVLGKLRSLFALHCMDKDSFFLEHRYITGNKALAINHSVNHICKELLPHTRSIIDAFGLEDHVIRAPIASDWISFYKL